MKMLEFYKSIIVWYIQWFYRIIDVGVLYRIRSVNFGQYISRTENPNELNSTYSELSNQN